MKNFKTYIMLILTVFTTLSLAQNLNLTVEDGQGTTVNLPLSLSNNNNNPNVTIDQSGDVNIITSSTAEFIGDAMGLVCTGVSPNITMSSVSNGTTSSTINWSIDNDAVFCLKKGAWSGLIEGTPLITNNQNFSQNVTSNGDYMLQCNNAFGSSENTINISTIIPVVAPTLTLQAITSSSINSGDSITFEWTIGNSPTSCTKSGAWSGSLASNEITNGTHQEIVSNITTAGTYNLICLNNAGNSGVKSISISVNGTDVPQFCLDNNSINPANILRDISTTDYIANGGGVWPAIGDNVSVGVANNRYVALKFTTTSVSETHSFFFEAAPLTFGSIPQGRTVSISECPGDFRPSLAKCYRGPNSGSSSFSWSTTGQFSDAQTCNLLKNHVYYFNVVHSLDEPNNVTSTCPSNAAKCGVIISNLQ